MEIKQRFIDSTYYAIPRKNNNFKLLILLAFNLILNKIIWKNFLFKNENKEAYIRKFKIKF